MLGEVREESLEVRREMAYSTLLGRRGMNYYLATYLPRLGDEPFGSVK